MYEYGIKRDAVSFLACFGKTGTHVSNVSLSVGGDPRWRARLTSGLGLLVVTDGGTAGLIVTAVLAHEGRKRVGRIHLSQSGFL